MALTLYGISTCGTVKKAKKWLDDRGVDYEWVDFRKTPPAQGTVDGWVSALGAKPMRNTSGGAYRALPDDKKTWDDATWATHFGQDPMLIKRPLIVKDGTAIKAGFRGSDEELQAQLLG